ncbi:hypothetical protein L228DRAFT_243310 [Xylona heveae TC161]|uniref:Telomerase reverse transcriptase n=1 Tax=Xylona heveae (strain CBS 132557 / TC161) TaxID=1328760 RepID=A0A165JYH0_XYLHT|nr:hypothetical protein L228DRAFT_243310 [Xylona heveae TC161]KZF26787.1 hypothetical protein L228DRAFT_243310 [Xylona heveae TC161]
MFLDTDLNSLTTVLSNLYELFSIAADRMYNYAKSLPRGKQPKQKIMIDTIRDVMRLAFVLMKSKLKHGKLRAVNYQNSVSKAQINWLAATAFQRALKKRQSVYGIILAYLDKCLSSSQPKSTAEKARMQRIIRTNWTKKSLEMNRAI